MNTKTKQKLKLPPMKFKKNEEQISVPENETIEDEIEVLEVVKERMKEEMFLDMNKGTKSND